MVGSSSAKTPHFSQNVSANASRKIIEARTFGIEKKKIKIKLDEILVRFLLRIGWNIHYSKEIKRKTRYLGAICRDTLIIIINYDFD